LNHFKATPGLKRQFDQRGAVQEGGLADCLDRYRDLNAAKFRAFPKSMDDQKMAARAENDLCQPFAFHEGLGIDEFERGRKLNSGNGRASRKAVEGAKAGIRGEYDLRQ
jgi:hypothetical protein